MLTPTLCFSNRCPYFPPQDALVLERYSGGTDISEESLKDLGFFKAAMWLNKNQKQWMRDFEQMQKDEISVRNLGGRVLSWKDQEFPESFKNLFHPPSLLFVLGSVELLNSRSVSVVGARQPTLLGIQWVQKEIPKLVETGLTIVSGGARGIDCESHTVALHAEGKTVAHLPGCVQNPYPKSNASIFERILKNNGALVAEFISTDSVRPENFHRRNRLIAAAGTGVVIVEAKLKSGTLMTAMRARDENRDILVVPGHPLMENYQGSLKLIGEGAALVKNAEDVLWHVAKEFF